MTQPAPESAPACSNWPCLRLDTKGKRQRVIIDLSISPNAKRSELVGWHDGALRMRVAAPPVEGAANDAVRRWLSDSLDMPQSDIELLRGATSRRKQWAVNADLPSVERWIENLIASGQIPALTV